MMNQVVYNRIVKAGFTALVLIFLTACKKENRCDCIKRTGNILKENRSVKDFDKLLVKDNINVFLMQDSVYKVIVEAGKNLVSLISTEVKEGTLIVENKNRCNWTRSYKEPINIYINVPSLVKITSDGYGKIESINTINTQEITIVLNNAGDAELALNSDWVWTQVNATSVLTLHGKTKDHYCGIGQNAFLYAQDFKSHYTWIHAVTAGLSYINASYKLDCEIDNIGDVYCYGAPSVVNNTGKGKGKLYLD